MTVQQMTSLATLHAVPDGDPCSLARMERYQLVYFQGDVWELDFIPLSIVRITDKHILDVSDQWEAGDLFQPVRLVEASLDTNPEGGIQ